MKCVLGLEKAARIWYNQDIDKSKFAKEHLTNLNIYDFWKAVLGQNEIEIRKYFQNDAYINWHCTNHVTSFIKTKEDKIVSMDEYWADDGNAPQWRLDKHIGKAIR